MNGGLLCQCRGECFKTAIREGLELTVGQTAPLDLKLEIGSVRSSVIVSAESTLVQDANGHRGGVIDKQRPFDNGAIANWRVKGSSQKVGFYWMEHPTIRRPAQQYRLRAAGGCSAGIGSDQRIRNAVWARGQYDATCPNIGSIIKAIVNVPKSDYPRQIQLGFRFLW
jgi:hypothetical protein